jgi:hypothetical protein
MWDMEGYLQEKRKEINYKYDFRYSQLIYVFGGLLLEKRISEKDIEGLDVEKIEAIKQCANILNNS